MTPVPTGRLPRRSASIIGRDEVVQQLAEQVLQRPLVSIVGPGGVGKTTVAIAVARQLADSFADGVHFVDLAPVTHARHLPGALALALGLAGATVDKVEHLSGYLEGREILLLLDSCEHLLEPVAALADALLGAGPDVHLVATSREPLRSGDEWVHRLAPMVLPTPEESLTAGHAMACSAVQLFCHRARDADPGFEIDDTLAPAVAALCRRLDGLPLALELAAARLPVWGIPGLLQQLDGRLLQLSGAAQGAPQRHQTLGALLDWSHELLSSAERLVLRRLSVFSGPFPLEAAGAVVGDDEASPAEVVAIVLDLAAKSLVARFGGEREPLFRLLDTTRAYAGARLVDVPERHALRLRHARYLCRTMLAANEAWMHTPRAEWCSQHARWIDDIRAALEWAFGPGGDRQAGIELTVATFALADQSALMGDYVEYLHQALHHLEHMSPPQPLLQIQLNIFPVVWHQNIADDGPNQIGPLKALRLAQGMEATDVMAAPLAGMWGLAFQNGAYPMSLHWAQRLQQLADDNGDHHAALVARRTRAQALHYLGDHDGAIALAREVLGHADTKIPLKYRPSPVSVSVSMRMLLARALWMKGLPEQALQMAAESVAFAEADTPVALCQALALAALPVALWCGDESSREEWIYRLRRQAAAYSFRYFQAWGAMYDTLFNRSTQDDAHIELALSRADGNWFVKLRDQMSTLQDHGLASDTMARVQAGEVGWCAAEALRVQALVLGRTGRPEDQAAGRALLLQARDVARRQASPGWGLRVATTLATWPGSAAERSEAATELAALYAAFTEGHHTTDLRAAAAVLAA